MFLMQHLEYLCIMHDKQYRNFLYQFHEHSIYSKENKIYLIITLYLMFVVTNRKALFSRYSRYLSLEHSQVEDSGDRILQESSGNRRNMEALFRPEIIGKNSENFQPEYCFHKITGITRNRAFPDRTGRPGFNNKQRQTTRIIESDQIL